MNHVSNLQINYYSKYLSVAALFSTYCCHAVSRQYCECKLFTTYSLFSLSPVIGRGGEQINKIQQDSGCKVQIAPGNTSLLAKTTIHTHSVSITVNTFMILVVLDTVFVQTAEAFQTEVSLSQVPLTPYSKFEPHCFSMWNHQTL